MLYSLGQSLKSEYRRIVSTLIVWTKAGIVDGLTDLTKESRAGHEPKQL